MPGAVLGESYLTGQIDVSIPGRTFGICVFDESGGYDETPHG